MRKRSGIEILYFTNTKKYKSKSCNGRRTCKVMQRWYIQMYYVNHYILSLFYIIHYMYLILYFRVNIKSILSPDIISINYLFISWHGSQFNFYLSILIETKKSLLSVQTLVLLYGICHFSLVELETFVRRIEEIIFRCGSIFQTDSLPLQCSFQDMNLSKVSGPS